MINKKDWTKLLRQLQKTIETLLDRIEKNSFDTDKKRYVDYYLKAGTIFFIFRDQDDKRHEYALILQKQI